MRDGPLTDSMERMATQRMS